MDVTLRTKKKKNGTGRRREPKACINIPVIDWRGTFEEI